MRLGIIGPSDVKAVAQILGHEREEYLGKVRDAARAVAASGFDIAVSANRGSSTAEFAREYRKARGGNVWCVIPLSDTEFGIGHLERGICDNEIDSGSWRANAAKFTESCDAMLCIGFGAGVIAEIGISKWLLKGKRIVVVRDCISAELPREAVRELDVSYAALNGLGAALEKLKKML